MAGGARKKIEGGSGACIRGHQKIPRTVHTSFLRIIAGKFLNAKAKLKWNAKKNNCQNFCNTILIIANLEHSSASQR
jgi:hypothetical protein